MRYIGAARLVIVYSGLFICFCCGANAKEIEIKSTVRFEGETAHCKISVEPRTSLITSVDFILPKGIGRQRLYSTIDGNLSFPLQSNRSFELLALITERSGKKQLLERHIKVAKPIRIKSHSKRVANRKWDWYVYVDTDNETLQSIEYVEYTLHPTFPNRVRRSTASSKKFRLDSGGWGEFTINVLIVFKDGKRYKTEHYLELE